MQWPAPRRRSATRTLEPEQLKELVEGKFVDALRTAAAEMTMEELHEKRGDLRQARARGGGRRPDQERARARSGFADPARPDRDGVLQPEQCVRRRRPDAADRADRAAQEAAQRRRAGHADRDPQQEPRGREAVARHRPRSRIRAPAAAARGGDRACAASAPSWHASARSANAKPSSAQISAQQAIEMARIRYRPRAGRRAHLERRADCRPRDRAAQGAWSWPSNSASIAVSQQSKAESEARAAADQARAKAVEPKKNACSPRARPRWPSARSRST